MVNLYEYRIKYIDSYENKFKTNIGILAAKSYTSAVAILIEYYVENNQNYIEEFTLNEVMPIYEMGQPLIKGCHFDTSSIEWRE